MFVIKYVYYSSTVSGACVTISGLCELTVIADKRATVQSTVVTKTCSSVISCSTIHELSVLHALECDAMTRNVVKTLANQNRVNCLVDMISQSNILSFYKKKKICARGIEDCQARSRQDV